MEEVEDFKYEFDLSVNSDCLLYSDVPLLLYVGYLYLHQFVKQDLMSCADKNNIISIITPLLEEGETIKEKDGHFELKLNNMNNEDIQYISFLLKYSLAPFKNFEVENNTIKFDCYETH
jgi:hypothetical protein